MKYLHVYILFFVFLMLSINACYYDNPPEIAPIEPEDVSFDTHLIPIFNSSCNTAGCHDGSREPDLSPDVAYNRLLEGGYVNLAVPEESILYKSVEFESGASGMPPGGPQLPEIDRIVILTWIQKGAPND